MSDTTKPTSMSYTDFIKICEEAGLELDDKAEQDFYFGQALGEVTEELMNATDAFPSMSSAHEGFAILKEEVDELWDEVKKRPSVRSVAMMRKEAVQVAAMAIRFIGDICIAKPEPKGN